MKLTPPPPTLHPLPIKQTDAHTLRERHRCYYVKIASGDIDRPSSMASPCALAMRAGFVSPARTGIYDVYIYVYYQRAVATRAPASRTNASGGNTQDSTGLGDRTSNLLRPKGYTRQDRFEFGRLQLGL